MGAVLLGIVEGQALFEVVLGGSQLSKPEQGGPQPSVGPHEESRVLYMLGQTEELLRQFMRRLELSPVQIKQREYHQHREELRSLPQLLAQLPRPGDGFFHFRGHIAFEGAQWDTKGHLQREFLLDTFSSIRQGLEQLQRLGEMTDCFAVRRTLTRALSGLLPVGNRLLYETRLGVVMSKKLRLGLFNLCKLLLQHLRNLLMLLLPFALDQ